MIEAVCLRVRGRGRGRVPPFGLSTRTEDGGNGVERWVVDSRSSSLRFAGSSPATWGWTGREGDDRGGMPGGSRDGFCDPWRGRERGGTSARGSNPRSRVRPPANLWKPSGFLAASLVRVFVSAIALPGSHAEWEVRVPSASVRDGQASGGVGFAPQIQRGASNERTRVFAD